MGLIGNYSVFNKLPMNFTGGVTIAQTRANFNNAAKNRNANSHFGLLASIPSGGGAPYAWSLPQKIGAMSSFTSAYASLSPSVILAGGLNLTASSSGSISVTTAQLDQVVILIANSIMSLSSTAATMNAAVNMTASSNMDISGAANVGAIIDMLASSSALLSGNLTFSALAHMTAESGGPTPLSPEGLAEAVWNSILSEYVTPGTAGKIVQEIKSNLASKLDKGTFIALK